MSAIHILEKLAADASFNLNTMSDKDRLQIAKLLEGKPTFNAILAHTAPDEDVPLQEEPEEGEEGENPNKDGQA